MKQVTSERGWKRITLPFNFPPTCTNSAYVMKSVYVKNLELFEQEDFFGKDVPVNKFETQESNITRSREGIYDSSRITVKLFLHNYNEKT